MALPELSPSVTGPEPGLVAPSTQRKGKIWLTYECEQGNRWRVYDIERVDRRPTLVPPGSRRATHRQFVIVGKHPQAVRYEFRAEDAEHELAPDRLQMQLYLGKRVKLRRRGPSSGSAAPPAGRTPGTAAR
jgi:hypothetical protein